MKHVKQTLAILLTLLMLVSAVPFAAFATELTAAQKACTHEWDASLDLAKCVLKDKATCKSYATYYKICKKCGASAKDVAGAENETIQNTVAGYDKNNHPENAIAAVKPEAVGTKLCQTGGWTPGKKCTACNTVLEDPVENKYPVAHKAAAGEEANCQHGAVCQWCGVPISGIDTNNHPKDQVTTIKAGVEPTCGEAGRKAILYCNACKKTIQNDDEIEPTGKHTQATAATCKKKATCSVCKKEYGEVDPTKHDLEHHDTVPVSCTADGKKEYWSCKDCGKLFSDDKGKTETTESALVIKHEAGKNHDLKKVDAKEATCYATGIKEHWYCNVCQHYYADKDAKTEMTQADTVVAKKDHTFGEWKYPDNYDCAKGGEVSRTCTVAKCGFIEKKTAAPGEHVDRKTEKAVDATCTTAGKTEKIYCGKCGTVIQEATEVKALGHDYKDAKATAKNDGTHTFTCNRCKQPGEPEKCVDEKEPRDCKCDVCGQQLTHTFTNYVSDGNATCAADGTKTAVCDVCGVAKDTVADEGSKNEAAHDYEWTDLEDATCIANGHRKGVCKICGNEVLQEITDSALGHIDPINVDWQYPEGFDCEVGGNRFKTCTRCGEITLTEPIEGRAHSPVIDPEVPKTCTTDGKSAGSHCDTCGKILTPQVVYQAEGHKADDKGFTVTQKVTCTVDGIQSATCAVCGETFTEKIPATGHTYVDTVVAPGCTKKGYTEHRCSVCNDVKQDHFTNPTGHKYKQTVTPATTESNGKVVQKCVYCGANDNYKVYRIKKITLSQTSFVRDSKAHKPSVTITDTKGNKLVKNTDYKLKFSDGRKAVGTYKVTITFKGEYKGKEVRKYKIVPPAVTKLTAKAGVKSATLSWARNKYADVYVIYWATAKDGKYKKLATTDKLTYTATKLASGKTYYFKVRAVRKLDNGNYYSAYSAIKAVKVK